MAGPLVEDGEERVGEGAARAPGGGEDGLDKLDAGEVADGGGNVVAVFDGAEGGVDVGELASLFEVERLPG